MCQGCILSPCLLNLYSEYIIQNANLDEPQDGIKISRRNINNLGYAEDTTLMVERKEELKSLLMKIREVKKLGCNSTLKIKSVASNTITSWQIDREKVEMVTDFILLGS